MVGRGADRQLGDLAARLDQERFVGRETILDAIGVALAGPSDARVFYVHGRGGVGKSGLLRAAERRAATAGHPVAHADGRLLAGDPSALAEAVEPARAEGTLLVIDELDELAPLHLDLTRLIGSVPASSSVVLVAGRRAPGREWFDGGLDHVMRSVALTPLDAADSRRVLAASGVDDPEEVEGLVSWSAGYPLALTVGAALHAADGSGDRVRRRDDTDHDELGARILARLVGNELDDVDPDVLDVAAVAPMVDGRLLAAVLPGRPTRGGLTQLRELSVSEAVGNRTTLHRLVRTAVRDRLRATDPDRYRLLVLRVADHLRSRAIDDPRLVFELGDLIEDPAMRVGFGPSATHYADNGRPGDIDAVREAEGLTGDEAWLARLARWHDERPEQCTNVRTASGELAGVAIVYSAERAPAWAEDHIECGPVLAHARAHGHLAQATFMHDVHLLVAPDDVAAIAEVVRVGNIGGVQRAGLPNPRYVYVTTTAWNDLDGSAATGYVEVEELRRSDGERTLLTILRDFGPDGTVGGLYAMIRAEQAAGDPDASATGRGQALLAALRAFHDDDVLVHSTLGDGRGEARVASARAEVEAAVDAAFGDSPADQLLRVALVRTYVDPKGGHAVARREVHMSRSSFYRHLQRARDRLAASVSAQ